MQRLSLYLLGAPRVERDGVPISLGRRKALALLAYLAVTGRPQSRDLLATWFWPESDSSRAHANLRRVLWTLRDTLGEPWLLSDHDMIALAASHDLRLDVQQFRERLASAPGSPAELEAAIEIYRGDFLEGFSLPDSLAFEEWQLFERESLRQEYARGLRLLAHLNQELQNFEPAIAAARRWLSLDPLHEPAHRLLMTLYARDGQVAAAIGQYQACARLLAEELGGEPHQETQALYHRIRSGELAVAEPARTTEASSPGSVMAQTRLNGLPHPLTPLVGREQELAALVSLLENPACRLLTITGYGGMGKTRLALEVAASPGASFPDGVAWVPLAPLDSSCPLVPAIASVLGLVLPAGEPARAQLLEFLGRRRVLLVMDNFEHLLDAAPLLADILASAPGVKILVTSRERLNLHGEWLFDLRGLLYPDRGQEATLEEYAAVELFRQAARRSCIGFTLAGEDIPAVARICRLVEGMPLGIELAASWVRVLSPSQIARQMEENLGFLSNGMRDLPDRHRSLCAVFDQSWALLSDEGRRLFPKLALFRGGFTLAAAEAVAGACIPLLQSLVDKSLVRRTGSDRYDTHDLLRQYALEKLEEAGDRDATSWSHLCYFRRLAEEAAAELYDPARANWTRRLGAERDNLRVALEWAQQHAHADERERLVTALHRAEAACCLSC
jgi:predicted ATPase/DNA-binding SARP family transcriptional activator